MAGVPRSSCRYRSQARDQAPLRQRLRELTAVRVRYGYRRLQVLLQREGWRVNHKRVYRLYREEGLSIRTKYREKRVSLPRVAPPPAQQPNKRWSIDFLADSLVDGRRFRVLTLVDYVSRVSPAIKVDFSLKGTQVVAVLARLKRTVGLPQRIASITGRSSSQRRWMPGLIGTGSRWSSRGRASPPIMPTSSRSTGTSVRSAWTNTGLQPSPRPGR